jgi:hypothetical protein
MTEEQIARERLAEIHGEVKDGKLHVTHWPKPRVSNSNFLSDMVADMDRQQHTPQVREGK